MLDKLRLCGVCVCVCVCVCVLQIQKRHCRVQRIIQHSKQFYFVKLVGYREKGIFLAYIRTKEIYILVEYSEE